MHRCSGVQQTIQSAVSRDVRKNRQDRQTQLKGHELEFIAQSPTGQGNALCNEFERRKLYSHWLLNVTSSVIGPGHNLSQSHPSQQVCQVQFFASTIYIPTSVGEQKAFSQRQSSGTLTTDLTLVRPQPHVHIHVVLHVALASRGVHVGAPRPLALYPHLCEETLQ